VRFTASRNFRRTSLCCQPGESSSGPTADATPDEFAATDEREHGASPRCALRGRVQRQNDLATFLAYLKFCRLHPAYDACFANQLRIFDWIDERRIEMLAEGRPH
jgi:hypothetical protein